MKAIFYNLCFGALDHAAQDGVKESWYIFNDNGRNNKDMHALPLLSKVQSSLSTLTIHSGRNI